VERKSTFPEIAEPKAYWDPLPGEVPEFMRPPMPERNQMFTIIRMLQEDADVVTTRA
jgi:hypothetical protein